MQQNYNVYHSADETQEAANSRQGEASAGLCGGVGVFICALQRNRRETGKRR